MRVLCCVSSVLVVVLAGCDDWAMRSDGMEPFLTHGFRADDMKTYVLKREDIAAAPPALVSGKNGFDWPLMLALWNESGRGSGEDCRTRDAFVCLHRAAEQHRPAFAYTTDFYIDSAQGWGAAARPDGTVIMFLFDGSPKGQVFPERAGWSLEYTVCRALADEKSAKRVLCAAPYFGRDKK